MPDENDKKPDNKYNMDFRIWGKDIVNEDKNKKPKPEPEKPKKFITGVEDTPSQPETKPEEVELVSANTWSRGVKGYTFNENCNLDGTLKFLCRTMRKRIMGDLYVRTEDGTEENLNHIAECTANDDGTFRFEIKLFYGNHYYDLLAKNRAEKCWYKLKNIRHSTGINTIDSAELEMPAEPMTTDLELSL